jgi:hypothetical protein
MKLYEQRGRRFEKLRTPDLRDRWAAAFNAACDGAPAKEDLDDLAAELRLRHLPRPYEMVPEAAAQVQAWIQEALNHPAQIEDLQWEMDAFLIALKKSTL